jgi:GDP-L-fucose synthase
MTAPVIFPLSGRRVWVAGHSGLAGSAVVRRLAARGDVEVLTVGHDALDLTRQTAVEDWLAATRPDVVILAAAKVGGILANATMPALFLRDNLAIQGNVIDAAHRSGVKKLLFLGSSCLYPRQAPQPMREEDLLSGPLEPTNEGYAVAKIAGLTMCRAYRRQYGADFVSVMPSNLYGPGDTYHPEHAHVPAALIRRFHDAKEAGAAEAVIWGSGRPRREFLCADDLAEACLFVLERYSGEQPLNVGTGQDMTIADFAALVADVVGFRGRLVFDPAHPDGAPRKLLDVSRLAALGWRARIPLRDGLASAYADFLNGGGRAGGRVSPQSTQSD